MNAYTTTTSSTTRMSVVAVAKEPVTGPTLLAAAYGGTVKFAKVRSSGTMRGWPVLAPDSKDRKAAEALRAEVAKAGKNGVSQAAKRHHTSVATIRRTLISLQFTEELEGMNKTALSALAKTANENAKSSPEKTPAKPESAKPASKKTATPAKPKGGAGPRQAAKKAHAAKMARESEETLAAAKAASTVR